MLRSLTRRLARLEGNLPSAEHFRTIIQQSALRDLSDEDLDLLREVTQMTGEECSLTVRHREAIARYQAAFESRRQAFEFA